MCRAGVCGFFRTAHLQPSNQLVHIPIGKAFDRVLDFNESAHKFKLANGREQGKHEAWESERG